jgi:hypothetical protein
VSAPQTVALILAPVPGRPSYYRATDATGHVLAQASRQPLLDAARALAASGLPPETVVTASHRGSAVVAMRATLAEATPWTIEESDRGGLRMRRWKPFQGAGSFRDGVAENAQEPAPSHLPPFPHLRPAIAAAAQRPAPELESRI